MSILKLDLDGWRLITQDLVHVDICRLLLTCPAVFRILRTDGGVIRVRLVADTRMVRVPPMILKFKHLRELEITPGFNIPGFSPGHLIFLPKTLWTLKLQFPNVFESFYRTFNCWTPSPTSASYGATYGIGPERTLIDLKDVLPDLRTFVAYSSSAGANPHEIIPALPRSLTHLELQLRTIPILESLYPPTNCAHPLPPNLVVLKLPRCGSFSQSNALSTLTSLERLYLPACPDLPRLPTSLVKLECRTPPTSYEFNAETTPSLTILILMGAKQPTDYSLPPSLLSLSLPYSRFCLSRHTTVLPQTLTKLDVQQFWIDSPGNTADTSATGRPDWERANFPTCLKHFNIRTSRTTSGRVNPGLYTTLYRVLPSNIEIANVGLHFLRIDNVHLLPASLKLIQEGIDITPHIPFVARDGSEKRTPDLASLFPELRECYMFSSSSAKLETMILPNSLTSIRASRNSQNDVEPNPGFLESQIGAWPPYLRKLHYTDDRYPSDRGLTALPSTITDLTLYASRYDHGPHEMSAIGLSKLPSCLTSLTIVSNLLPEPTWLHHLPHSLRSLVLDQYDGMMDEHMTSMPRTVTCINMRNSTKLTDACLPHLPPALRELRLRRNRNFTTELIRLRPHSLLTIDLRKNSNFAKRLTLPPALSIKTKRISQGF